MKIITSSEFDNEVKKGVVLVDFFADWCGPCKMLSPVLEQVEALYDGKLTVVKINTDDNPDLAQKFGVMSIPNMFLFKDGEVVGNKMGFASKNDILNFINSSIQ